MQTGATGVIARLSSDAENFWAGSWPSVAQPSMVVVGASQEVQSQELQLARGSAFLGRADVIYSPKCGHFLRSWVEGVLMPHQFVLVFPRNTPEIPRGCTNCDQEILPWLESRITSIAGGVTMLDGRGCWLEKEVPVCENIRAFYAKYAELNRDQRLGLLEASLWAAENSSPKQDAVFIQVDDTAVVVPRGELGEIVASLKR